MKRIVLSLLLVSATLTGIVAQKGPIVRTALNFSALSNDEPAPAQSTSGISVTTNAKIGYTIGLGYQNDDARVPFKTLLSYSSQGTTRKISGLKEVLTLDYLQFNFIGRVFNIKEKLSISAGPQLGYLIGAKSKFNGVQKSALDSVAKIDVGFVFDFAYPLNKNKTVNAFAVWNVGFVDIPKGDAKGTNNSIQLGIEFLFERRKK